MTKGNINEVREFYKGKYKKIFDELNDKGIENYKWDENCGKWIELWCAINNKKIKINIGLNNKYNLWKNGEKIGSYKSQEEIINKIKKL